MNESLRKALTDQASAGRATTYRELAGHLGLKPPQTIHRLAEALEALMEEDVMAGRPMLAALCVSRTRPGLPGPGFFVKAVELGVFAGDPQGPEAGPFHRRESQRAFAYYAIQASQSAL